MDDNISARISQKLCEALFILQQKFMSLEEIGCGKLGMTRALQRRVIIIRHTIKAHDLMAERNQPAAQMKADEASRSGDEKAHQEPFDSFTLYALRGLCEARPRLNGTG